MLERLRFSQPLVRQNGFCRCTRRKDVRNPIRRFCRQPLVQLLGARYGLNERMLRYDDSSSLFVAAFVIAPLFATEVDKLFVRYCPRLVALAKASVRNWGYWSARGRS